MDNWIERHFSDNRRAQKAIAAVAGVILALGFTAFVLAAILSMIG